MQNTSEFRVALESSATNGTDDVIQIMAGVYNTQVDLAGKFSYLSNETSNLKIIGETGAILDGDTTDDCLYFNAQNMNSINIENIEVRNCVNGISSLSGFTLNRGVIHDNSANGILAPNDSTTIEIYDTTVSNSGESGISRAVADRAPLIIERTTISNSGSYGIYSNTGNGSSHILADEIEIFESGNNGIRGGYNSKLAINNSYIHHNNYAGISVRYRGYIHLTNSIVSHNSGHGIYGGLNISNDYIISNSIIHSNTEAGVAIGGSYGSDIIIQNSAIIENNIGIELLSIKSGITNFIAINSILNNTTFEFKGKPGAEIFVSTYNSILGRGNQDDITTNTNNKTFVASDFIDYVNFNLESVIFSSLIDAGVSSLEGFNLPTTDYNGNSRIAGGSMDIGPYEYTTTIPTISQITYTGELKEYSEIFLNAQYQLTPNRSLSTIEYKFSETGDWGSSPNHTFSEKGIYTFYVRVTDSDGEFSTGSIILDAQELPFSEMTDDQKIESSIKPENFTAIMNIISSRVNEAENQGILSVIENPTYYNLVSNDDLSLNSNAINDLPSGWSLVSTPFEVTNLNMFTGAQIIWIYTSNEWQGWSSNTGKLNDIASSECCSTISSIPAGSGIWINK